MNTLIPTLQTFDAQHAPGAPGMLPNWCNGAKQMVGTSLGPARVWFTVGQGILNEIYFPRVDIPQIRDMGFIIGDGQHFWVEVKRLPDCQVACVEAGIPVVTITHQHERFTFTQRITTDSNRDVILVDIRLTGDDTLRPYVLLAPHLGATGRDNIAEVGQYRGRRVLWAEQGPFGLALVAVDANQQEALGMGSTGYSGSSDGWQDFHQYGFLQHYYQQAGPGNIALTGALPPQATLALGLEGSRESAATLAISALLQPFEHTWQASIAEWRNWHQTYRLPKLLNTLPAELVEQVKTSAMVLRVHHDQTFCGALIASLSVPWGESQEERPGYHLVWPRDLVESAGALLALGNIVEAREILRYLLATQREDGSWYQNQWIGGKPYWFGIQLDQVAFPVLLAGMLADRQALDGIVVSNMVQRALAFIVLNGPVSPQDRWEEDSGINTFTLTVCIAALVAGARFLPETDQPFVLALADFWNAQLDHWTAVHDTPFARLHGVEGYYPRILPPDILTDDAALGRAMPIKNHAIDPGLPPTEQIGVDFLQLVRYGLRAPDAPLIQDTLKLVDELLRMDLPQGPCWYRYNSDGYGEQADGSAYDGTGQGRLWPLLTGERGHYALALGEDALPYLQAMRNFADRAGMIPEQVWDSDAIPEQQLWKGRATHSAMPLAWAHAEYIKLALSIVEGRPVDRPEAVWQRYGGKIPVTNRVYWTVQAPLLTLPAGQQLGICLAKPSVLQWQDDVGNTYSLSTKALAMGVHVAYLPPLAAGVKHISFTLPTLDNQSQTYTIAVVGTPTCSVSISG